MRAFRKIVALYKSNNFFGFFLSVYSYLFASKADCLLQCQQLLKGKIGLEIGGPSRIFSKNGNLPLYATIERLDNCNFSDETIWEGRLIAGANFFYDKNRLPGNQYLLEATDLHIIPSDSYDFVLSSHVIEHIANPILALKEWMRILKEDGVLILIVPHKDATFDHRRPVTSLEHLISDFQYGTTEDDQTHLAEIMMLHDLAKDPEAGDFENFRARSEKNLLNRCLHHHVFNTLSAVKLVDYVGLQLLAVEAIFPMHIILVARKQESGRQVKNNSVFLGNVIDLLTNSPFRSDQEEISLLKSVSN